MIGTRTSVPLFGGTLLVLPVVSVPVALVGTAGASGVGSGALPLGIPNNPGLVGGTLSFQAVFLDSGAAFNLSMTNGVELWIG